MEYQMTKFISVLFLSLIISGCSLLPERVKIVEVPVPVVVYRDVIPAEVEDLEPLPIYNLSKESTEDEILVAISTSVVMLESYRKELEESIRPFREQNSDPFFQYREALERYLSNEKESQ